MICRLVMPVASSRETQHRLEINDHSMMVVTHRCNIKFARNPTSLDSQHFQERNTAIKSMRLGLLLDGTHVAPSPLCSQRRSPLGVSWSAAKLPKCFDVDDPNLPLRVNAHVRRHIISECRQHFSQGLPPSLGALSWRSTGLCATTTFASVVLERTATMSTEELWTTVRCSRARCSIRVHSPSRPSSVSDVTMTKSALTTNCDRQATFLQANDLDASVLTSARESRLPRQDPQTIRFPFFCRAEA